MLPFDLVIINYHILLYLKQHFVLLFYSPTGHRVQLVSLVCVDRRVIKALADHWVKKVTKETKDMTAKRVTSDKRENEDRKVFKVPLDWRDQKGQKVSKVREEKLDHPVLPERKENWVFPVSLATLARLARRETKAHLDDLAHPATKEIEYILQMDDFF